MEIKTLTLPLAKEAALDLRAGDVVSLNGTVVTGRDRVHKFLVEEKPRKEDIPFDLSGLILYHCGPVIEQVDGGFRVVAAGPTTSMRVEMYEAAVIREYNLSGIMGKGGMGEKTRQALKDNSCVYFHTMGGAAVYLADRIIKVAGVWKLEEFGPTEAMWLLEVKEFPAIVTMDAHGNDMHRDIEKESFKRFSQLIRSE